MATILSFGLLIVGFLLLIKGADYLVDGASSIAKKLGIRDIVIGLTVVSFGTSAPELVVNILSALNGSFDLAVGNIVGSNIANTFLILGVSAIIYPLAIKSGTVWKEIPLSVLASLALFFLINDALIDQSSASVISRSDGLTLLLFFAIFLYYSYGISKATGEADDATKTYSGLISTLMIIGGIFGLVLGGRFIVDSAIQIAAGFGFSEGLIGLTIVALGTSLPELATSAVAAYKHKADIAVGNVVGSNIFNIFFVIAVTSIIAPLPMGPALNLDISIMTTSAFLLFFAMFVGKKHKLERWQGYSFLTLYISYLVFLFWRG